ncbi:MAG: ABC transporter substrate-binding protein [Haloferacaceae archaeon]
MTSPTETDDIKANTDGGSRLSRRSALKATGAGIVSMSLAGCAGGIGGGGGDSVKLGVALPTSGPYGAVGQSMQKGVKLGIRHTMERDAFEGEIEAVYRDTKTDPGTGRKRAQELVNQESVDIIAGAWSSSVGLAIESFVKEQEIPFLTYIGTNKITGEKCSKYTFDNDASAAQQAGGSLGYALRQGLGKTVYQLVADYEWGQSHNRYIKNTLLPRHDAELVGSSFVPLGKGDYSDVMATAKDSGADIVYLTFAGSDAVTAIKQAEQFGVMDQSVCPAPLTGIVTGGAVPPRALAHENFIGATPWYWSYDQAEASTKFRQEFHDEFGENPYGFAAVAYQSIRTAFDAMGNANGTLSSTEDKDAWQSNMEGKKLIPQIWGKGSTWRACDHRATVPHMAVRGLPKGERNDENQKLYKILDVPDQPDALMRKCSETGCSL